MPNDQSQAPQTTAIAQRAEKAVVRDSGLFHNLMDTSRFEHMQRVAKVFANSALVPEHFRGKEADCFIAVEMAMRLELHPFNLMQSLYVVHGKPGIEAKMAIALINSSGIFEGPLQWTLSGEGMKRQAIARAVHAKSKQVCEATVTMEMAKAEGWIDKAGSKWKTMPDLMLQYRSASFFARLFCPEVIFGMQTAEELHDTEIDVTPQNTGATTAQRPKTLKERVTGNGGVVDAEPIPNGRVEAEVGREPQPAAQEPAGAAGAPSEAPEAQKEPASAAKAAQEPGIPFDEVLRMAKKAKSADQADVVRDALNDPAYTEAQKADVKTILDSKTFP